MVHAAKSGRNNQVAACKYRQDFGSVNQQAKINLSLHVLQDTAASM